MTGSYIKNKKKIDKSMSVYSFIFWIINFIFAQISINMLLKIITASREKWFNEAVQAEIQDDPFFASRTEMIVGTVIVVMVAVIVFSMVTVILFRNMQLRNMLTQMGVLTTIGYNKRQIYRFCMMEPMADIVVAFPVSVVVSYLIWLAIGKTKVVSKLMVLMNNHITMDIISYVLCGMLMIVVIMLHTRHYVEVNLKKGIRYMLGKGIV